jgi:hypothetical protein
MLFEQRINARKFAETEVNPYTPEAVDRRDSVVKEEKI